MNSRTSVGMRPVDNPDPGHVQGTLPAHLESIPVVPVLTVPSVELSVQLAEALVRAGLNVIEVTLRTDAALEVIDAMRSVEGAVIGAGTLLHRRDVERCKEAGASFGVSPGSTNEVLDACEHVGLPLLPGIDSVTTAMENLARGYRYQKFFPSEQSGGVGKLQALYGPLPDIRFCPTGGINSQNAADYLALPNVCCVGGTWVAPTPQIETHQWHNIEETATAASLL